MEFKVNVRHTDISQDMKAYMEQKAKKLLRYLDRIQEVNVIIEPIKYSFEVEMLITTDLFSLTAKQQGNDLRSTFDRTFHTVERKLKREKDKIVKDKKHTRETLRRAEPLEEL